MWPCGPARFRAVGHAAAPYVLVLVVVAAAYMALQHQRLQTASATLDTRTLQRDQAMAAAASSDQAVDRLEASMANRDAVAATLRTSRDGLAAQLRVSLAKIRQASDDCGKTDTPDDQLRELCRYAGARPDADGSYRAVIGLDSGAGCAAFVGQNAR